MSLIDFKEILKKKKLSDSYAHLQSGKKQRGDVLTEEIQVSEAMASGGRAGYALGSPEFQGEELDPATDDLNELTSWWKSEVNKSFDS